MPSMVNMSYIREDQARIRRQLTQKAIELAMQGRWEEAVAVNREILDSFPSDPDAYNRLGRALMELGRYPEARQAYQQALELDPYNSIAKKNLERLAVLGDQAGAPQREPQRVTPQLFMSEMGRTGVVLLEHTAPQEVLARKAAGDEVFLRVDNQRLIVEDAQGTYLGEVEPRHALRLIRLMQGGNRYAAAIASIGDDQVRVMVREVYQHPDLAGRLSFPPARAEALRTAEVTAEDEEEVMALDEGDEEPLPPSDLEEPEAGVEDWEGLGD